MKKAQMLQFLFYTILALVIFIPTISWASQFFKLGDKSLKSFNELSGTISSINDGKIKSMPLYLNPKNLIVGFSKDASATESVIYNTWPSDVTIRSASRPSECEKEKSCICLCKEGVKLESNSIICTEKVICNKFEKTNFFEKRPVGEIPFKHSKLSKKTEWRNGFFLSNSKDTTLLKRIYPVDTVQARSRVPNTITVYVQRYKDFVNVCYDKNCITNQMIDDLNKEDAIKEFNIFEENYFKCKIKKDGYCNTFSIVLPERYYLYYITKQDLTDIMSVGNVGKIFLIHTENTDLEYIKDNLKDLKVKDNKDKEIHIDGKIFKDVDPKQEYDSGLLDDFAAYEMKVKDKEIIFNQI